MPITTKEKYKLNVLYIVFVEEKDVYQIYAYLLYRWNYPFWNLGR